MLNLATFEQLFHSFLGCLEMQVNYMKTDLVVAARNTRTRIHVQKDVICFSTDISYFILIIDSVIHQYIVQLS